MKLVCGLGNPGSQYEFTRHNFGFLVVDALAERYGHSLTWKEKDGAQIAQVSVEGEKLLLVKPSTYMNCSGEPLQKVMRFFKVGAEDVVVVHDEVDLPLGRMQVRKGGGNGGHNGLKSIDSRIGTKDYHRIRMGIGRPTGEEGPRETSDWVLSRFRDDERELLDRQIEYGVAAVRTFVVDGLSEAQREFNKRKLS